MEAQLFKSFVWGGFESSCHRRRDGVRLDLIAATEHDRLAINDYEQLRACGIRTVREGVRWHLIERQKGVYSWTSLLPMIDAARLTHTQVVWDLCHYGWPDDIDVFRPEFVERFASFAARCAAVILDANLSDGWRFYTPINEISFLAWAGGEVGYLNPFSHGRGNELKYQLVRASIAAMDAIWSVDPGARFLTVDPVIEVTAQRDDECQAAQRSTASQFDAWDMLCGDTMPGFGGHPRYLDVIGANHYQQSQWFLGGGAVAVGASERRPLSSMLLELHRRYRRPIVVAETGAEGAMRLPWFQYVVGEVARAQEQAAVLGICLYPVLDYPGWDDCRHCEAGLLGVPEPTSSVDFGSSARQPYEPLRQAVAKFAEQHG